MCNKDINLPKNFNPPTEISHHSFILEVLADKHNEIDYEAWTSSKEELKGIFGPKSNWPGNVFSLEQMIKYISTNIRQITNVMKKNYKITKDDYITQLKNQRANRSLV